MSSPQDLVEAVKGDPELLAAAEWSVCYKQASRGDREPAVGLSPKGQTALYLIGGLPKIATSTAEEATWQRKEFIRFWMVASDEITSLLGLPQAKPTPVEVVMLQKLGQAWKIVFVLTGLTHRHPLGSVAKSC